MQKTSDLIMALETIKSKNYLRKNYKERLDIVEKILIELGIVYKKSFIWSCRFGLHDVDVRYLDFYLPDYNCAIDCDCPNKTPEYEPMLNKYCQKRGIYLINISYDTLKVKSYLLSKLKEVTAVDDS